VQSAKFREDITYDDRNREADHQRLVFSPEGVGDGGAQHGHVVADSDPVVHARHVRCSVAMENVLKVHDQAQVDPVECCDLQELQG
jgi:hypothetical protein